MFLDNFINKPNLNYFQRKDKVCNVSSENATADLPDADSFLSDPGYLQYVYEIEHYGADYHDKLINYQAFLENRKNMEFGCIVSVEEITRALLILDIKSCPIITDDINTAYHKVLIKYGPRHSNAWLEMRKLITVANDILSSQDLLIVNEIANKNEGHCDYTEALNTALNKIIDMPGLHIDVWDLEFRIKGDTEEHYETLKQTGFYQNKDDSCWTFKPGARAIIVAHNHPANEPEFGVDNLESLKN